MAKLPFDLKGFSKVESNDEHTVMRNKSGHEIKVMHKPLSEDMRKALKALPMSKKEDAPQDKKKPQKLDLGGTVDPLQNAYDKPAPPVSDSGGGGGSGGLAQLAGLAAMMNKGGKVSKAYNDRPAAAYDEGGEVSGAEQVSSGARMSGPEYDRYREQKQANQAPKKNEQGNIIQPAWSPHMADGGEVGDAIQTAADKGSPITINIGHPQMPDKLQSPPPAWGEAPAGQASPQFQDVVGVPKEQQAKMFEAQQQAQAAQKEAQMPAAQLAPPMDPMTSATQPGASPQAAAMGAPADPYGIDAYQKALGIGIDEQKAGLLGEARGMGLQGGMQARALQDTEVQQQQNAKDFTTHLQELNSERSNFIHDLENKHIDPQHYWNDKTLGGKISTAIGIIIGGMGGSDAPLKFLQQQMERDIDAQKAEIGKSETLLSANYKQFGNMRDAMDMTRIMQNDILVNKLKEAASRAANPIAHANALKAIGQIDADSAGKLQTGAMRKTLIEGMGANGNPTDTAAVPQMIKAYRMLGMHDEAKSLEERFVPSVGVATVPVPQTVRDTIIAKQTLGKMAGDLFKWSSQHSGSLDPATIAEGRTKAAELQSMYRNAINGGIFKKGEQEFIDNIVMSDPTAFFNNIRVLPRLREVINSNNSQLNVLKKGYGFPTTQIQEAAPIMPAHRK